MIFPREALLLTRRNELLFNDCDVARMRRDRGDTSSQNRRLRQLNVAYRGPSA